MALVSPGYGRACVTAVAKSFCHKVAKQQQWACDLQVDQLETSLQGDECGVSLARLTASSLTT